MGDGCNGGLLDTTRVSVVGHPHALGSAQVSTLQQGMDATSWEQGERCNELRSHASVPTIYLHHIAGYKFPNFDELFAKARSLFQDDLDLVSLDALLYLHGTEIETKVAQNIREN